MFLCISASFLFSLCVCVYVMKWPGFYRTYALNCNLHQTLYYHALRIALSVCAAGNSNAPSLQSVTFKVAEREKKSRRNIAQVKDDEGKQRRKKMRYEEEFKWNTTEASKRESIRRNNIPKTTNEIAILSIFSIQNSVDENHSRWCSNIHHHVMLHNIRQPKTKHCVPLNTIWAFRFKHILKFIPFHVIYFDFQLNKHN